MNKELRLEEGSLLSKIAGAGTASFGVKATAALGVSVIADALDYAAAPVFALPVIGDVADAFVSGVLYSITKSKKAAAINALEFIPVIGDFIPAYTLSTLLWIRQESSKRRKALGKTREATIITADQKRTFGKSINESTTAAATHGLGKDEENNGYYYNSPSDFRGSKSSGDLGEDKKEEGEEKMKRLLASRYAKWRKGKQ